LDFGTPIRRLDERFAPRAARTSRLDNLAERTADVERQLCNELGVLEQRRSARKEA